MAVVTDKLSSTDIKRIVEGIRNLSEEDSHPYVIGQAYLIRTVTMIQTGRLCAVFPQELVLDEAAWIADTGRFATTLVSLDFLEVEPFPDGPVIVGRGAIVDCVAIARTQRVQK